MRDVTKTCANCGRTQETGNFCEACGTRLTALPAPTPSAGPPEAAQVGTATTVEPVLASTPVTPAGDVSAAAPPPYAGLQYGTAQAGSPQPEARRYAEQYTAPEQGAPPYGARRYESPPRVPGDDVWSGLADFTFRRFPTPGLVRLAWAVTLIWAALSLIVSLWLISDGWGGGISVFMVLKAIAVAVFTVLVVRVALEAALALHRIRERKDQTPSDNRP